MKLVIAAITIFTSVLLCDPSISAQQTEPTGSAIVQITCADTGTPARYIDVTLRPVPDAGKESSPPHKTVEDHTDSNGNVIFANLPVGMYFIDAKLAGYISPLRLISDGALKSQDTETRSLVLNAVPHLTVASNTTARAVMSLERGAAISGRVTYYDGSPIEDNRVEVTQIKNNQSAIYKKNVSFYGTTDDRGMYRVTGLSPGTYIASTRITSGHITMRIIGKNSAIPTITQPGDVNLTFYARATPLKAKAQQILVARGDEQQGIDLIANLDDFHSFSGYVNRHGEVIPNASLELDDVNDPVNRHGTLTDQTGYFRFDLLPEGHYVLDIYPPPAGIGGKPLYSIPLLITNADKLDLNVDILSKPQ